MVVYFDGVCNLCNGWVRFLRKYDKHKKLQLISLQSVEAKQYFDETPEILSLQTIVFVKNSNRYFASDAVLMILKELNFPFSFLAKCMHLFPKKWRDAVYFYIAKNRYRWFGTCEINGL